MIARGLWFLQSNAFEQFSSTRHVFPHISIQTHKDGIESEASLMLAIIHNRGKVMQPVRSEKLTVLSYF